MSHQEQSYKILSVKPGTKCPAVAVFDNRDLVYWRNKQIRGKKIPDSKALGRLKDILYGLIEFWNPDVIAVEDIFYVQAKESGLLNTLVREMRKTAGKRKLEVCFYSPVSVRKFICGEEKPTKLNTARILATKHYPWLYRNYEKEKKRKWYEIKHGLRIFDAVAVGLYCFNRLKSRRKIKIK